MFIFYRITCIDRDGNLMMNTPFEGFKVQVLTFSQSVSLSFVRSLGPFQQKSLTWAVSDFRFGAIFFSRFEIQILRPKKEREKIV